jgi:thermostable 8-oxoguanine DNA glycosylase
MSELDGKIDESIAELKQYVAFSPDINNAIKGLEQLKQELRNLTKENIDEVLKGVDEAYRSSFEFSSYIPKTFTTLKTIKEWLENKKASM